MPQPIANGAGVYLIHLSKPMKRGRYTSQHYIGFSEDPKRRLWKHRRKQGCRFLQAAKEKHGKRIGFRLVRTWPGLGREFERYLKNRKSAKALCPICSPDTWMNNAPHPDAFAYE
jgi:hypothetical protein